MWIPHPLASLLNMQLAPAVWTILDTAQGIFAQSCGLRIDPLLNHHLKALQNTEVFSPQKSPQLFVFP
jgi:hypothetical protein